MTLSLIVRLLLIALVVGASVAPTTVQAQWPRDDRYFRDPFRRGPAPPFFRYPSRRDVIRPPRGVRRQEARPPATASPRGTIYGSKDAADRNRKTQATEYVVVLGDSLADQLAQGLADAFLEERPEVAVITKTRASSGLVRADFYDWPAEVPEVLDGEEPSALAIMLGANDRQALKDQSGSHEIRSDRWRELYSERVEAMVNQARQRGAPVFIVGLPSMRSGRLSADMEYINEILREQARKLDVTFIDIWDGFVDEEGEFMTFGPALDGQRRRLRMGDGVHFSRAGARKVAHYLERDLVRLFDQGPRELVVPDDGPEIAPSGRPVAGPVLPLTQPAGPVGELAGGERRAAARGDENARRVLVEGLPAEPVAGRADDFRWPRSDVTVARPEDSDAPAAGADPPSTESGDQASGVQDAPAANRSMPRVLRPGAGGQQTITVPEANRTR